MKRNSLVLWIVGVLVLAYFMARDPNLNGIGEEYMTPVPESFESVPRR